MYFENRRDAGNRLGRALTAHRFENPLVLAIPKGGIEIGLRVAEHLDAEFAVVITRKLPFPGNPEAGFGAIAEDGSTYIIEAAARSVSEPARRKAEEAQRAEITRRVELLRAGAPLPDMTGRTVIIADDGVAMGSTMLASIALCRNQGAGRVIAAAPVGSPRVLPTLEETADMVVLLETPSSFRAVASAYAQWSDVSDDEAVAFLQAHEKAANPMR